MAGKWQNGGPGWFMGAAILQLLCGVAVLIVDPIPLSTK